MSRVFLHLRMSNGGGVKLPPTCISSSAAPRIKIPTAIPMFSRSSFSMVLTVMSPEVGMLPEIDMASDEQEIISYATGQLDVDK